MTAPTEPTPAENLSIDDAASEGRSSSSQEGDLPADDDLPQTIEAARKLRF